MSRVEDYYTPGTFIDTEMCEDRNHNSRIDAPWTDISSSFRRLPWLFWFSLLSLHHLFLAPMDKNDVCDRAIVSRPSDLRSTSIWEASERWEPSAMSLESHHHNLVVDSCSLVDADGHVHEQYDMCPQAYQQTEGART